MDPLGAAKDPLGAPPSIVNVDDLSPWSSSDPPLYEVTNSDGGTPTREPPFSCNEEINDRVALWCGNITELSITAIVNSTNESMSERSPLSEVVFKLAGPELRHEIRSDIKSCKTGETRLTKAYLLPSRYIIHTVGPRYNARYQTAAENALHNCYRNVMKAARENKISELAICCIHSSRRHYPTEEGAHIALRTVRRILEHFISDFEKVIFVVSDADNNVYTRLMPLYFPRSEGESRYGALHLPFNLGNEFGEPVIPERQIRISDKPVVIPGWRDTEDNYDDEDVPTLREQFDLSVAVGQHAFAKMETDHDASRRLKIKGRTNIEAERAFVLRRYTGLVKRARKEDLTEIASLRCLYQSGFDKLGRPVLIFVARNFYFDKIDLEKAVLYLLHVMDSIVAQKYSVIYLHTLCNGENQPSSSFLKEIYKILDERYRENLHAFYMVHPTIWTRLTIWWFTTFTASHIKDRVKIVPGVEYLYSVISPDQLDFPPFVMDHDLKVNGARYYVPTAATDGL